MSALKAPTILEADTPMDTPMGTRWFQATIRIPPSINSSYHGNQNGGLRLSSAARAWKEEAALIFARWSPLPPGDYLLVVEYDLYSTMAKDLDGVAKILIDAISAQLRVNDNRVMRIVARKQCVPRDQERIELHVVCEPQGKRR